MKGEVGGRKPEGEHPRQKAKQEAMADRSARRLWGAHTSRGHLTSGIMCVWTQAQGCGLGWGLPVERGSELEAPGQQSMPLLLPQPVPPPTHTPHKHVHTYTQPVAPGSL